MDDNKRKAQNQSEVLNEQQSYAASFNGKHLLVLAGAGTGKTHTIINRAKYLINSGVDPHRILILSFTRKSAREIVERIIRDFDSKPDGLVGQTFHSWCYSIIHSYPNVFPEAEYSLFDDEDQDSCFKLLCGRKWKVKKSQDNQERITPNHIQSVYSYIINTKCSLADAIRMKIYDNAPSDLDVSADVKVIAGVITMYIAYKQERKYIDYDDILLVVCKYLKHNEGLRHIIAKSYEHILIDEMQDTNPLQYELLSSFYDDCHLFCVGDDAQSIYAFRGADFKTIHRFAEIVPEAETCKLTLNYRSTQEILDLSNWLLSQSPLKYDKELVAARGKGIKPQILEWGDEYDEAEDITQKMIDSISTLGKKWGDNLALSRTQWGLRKLEGLCIKKKIPYIILGGGKLLKMSHIRDVTSALRIVANYLDELAWVRYLQLWDGIGPVTSAKIIGEIVMEKNLLDSLTLLKKMNLQKEISEILLSIVDLQSNPRESVEKVVDGMSERLSQIYADSWHWRKNDFEILAELAGGSPSVTSFISEYILDPQLELKKAGADPEDHVILSTIHSAKGLEADSVYVVNASAHSYPSTRAILNGENAIEEERRCLYVALTRAKNRLFIYRDNHVKHISNIDNNYYFLQDVPKELYDEGYIGIQRQLKEIEIQSNPQKINLYSDFDFFDASGTDENESTNDSDSGITPTDKVENDSGIVYVDAPNDSLDSSFIEASKLQIKVGDIVEHKRYGRGTVKEIKTSPRGDSLAFNVVFDADDQTRILLNKLDKLKLIK